MSIVKKYLLLFFDFFKIGLFTFGGGYAMISMISAQIVEKRKYITDEEFSNVVAIAESTPGPIAINSATYIGFRQGGVFGSILSSIAVSLPSFIIIYLISIFLPHVLDVAIIEKAFKGVQCAVVILILNASLKLLKNVKKNAFSIVLIVLSAGLLILFDFLSVNVSTIYFILVGGFVGFFFYYFKMKKDERQETQETQANQDEQISSNEEAQQ